MNALYPTIPFHPTLALSALETCKILIEAFPNIVTKSGSAGRRAGEAGQGARWLAGWLRLFTSQEMK